MDMQAQGVRRERKLDRHVPAHLPPALLNEICEQVLSAYSAAPYGGIEIGMVLFGKRIGETVHVQAWRPIACSHLLGPRFILSPTDEALVPGVLSTPERDPTLAGTEPVGWCCSHTRSELKLLDREVDFHDRYFQKPGDLALILKPRSPLRAEGSVFGRKADGLMQVGEPLLTVQLPAVEPTAPPVPVASLKPIGEKAIAEPFLEPSRLSADLQPVPPRRAEVILVKGWQMQRISVLACLLAILTVLVYALFREYPRPAPPPAPTLSVALKPTAAGLAFVWKSNLPENSSAHASILEQTGTEYVDLTGSFAPSGVLVFPHRSGNVQTVLSVRSGGRTYTGKATYSDPAATQIAAPPPPAPAPIAAAKPGKPLKPLRRRRRHHRSS
jgi:hypothetical protein